MNSSAACTKHQQAKLISNISNDGQSESSYTAHQSRTKAVSWIPGYRGTEMREKISSFKRSLLKGKWSQNASTNKFAPRDRRECVAGRIIHVGKGVMNWKGCRKCAALSAALWNGWGVCRNRCSDALWSIFSPKEMTLCIQRGHVGCVHVDVPPLSKGHIVGLEIFFKEWGERGRLCSHLHRSGSFLLCSGLSALNGDGIVSQHCFGADFRKVIRGLVSVCLLHLNSQQRTSLVLFDVGGA